MKPTVEDCEKVIRMCNWETVKRILKEVNYEVKRSNCNG